MSGKDGGEKSGESNKAVDKSITNFPRIPKISRKEKQSGKPTKEMEGKEDQKKPKKATPSTDTLATLLDKTLDIEMEDVEMETDGIPYTEDELLQEKEADSSDSEEPIEHEDDEYGHMFQDIEPELFALQGGKSGTATAAAQGKLIAGLENIHEMLKQLLDTASTIHGFSKATFESEKVGRDGTIVSDRIWRNKMEKSINTGIATSTRKIVEEVIRSLAHAQDNQRYQKQMEERQAQIEFELVPKSKPKPTPHQALQSFGKPKRASPLDTFRAKWNSPRTIIPKVAVPKTIAKTGKRGKGSWCAMCESPTHTSRQCRRYPTREERCLRLSYLGHCSVCHRKHVGPCQGSPVKCDLCHGHHPSETCPLLFK